MLKATIKQWQAGIDAYKAGNSNEAINCFKSIDDTSKILYCLGVVYFKQNNYSEASTAFSKSVRCDPFLAVSYFMLGVCNHLKNDLSKASTHYDEAIQSLRGHEYIDYKQLGMDYKLLLCEILYNKALCMQKSGGQGTINELLRSAIGCKFVRDEKTRFRFEDTCNALATGKQSAPPFNVPSDLMFLPPRIKAEKPPIGGATREDPPSRPSPSPSPAPSLSSLPRSTPQTTSNSASSNGPPPVPTKPGSKKLPPRPISLKTEAAVITVKCFYKDRRLIQISTSSPDFADLQEKIRAKFLVDNLEIRYQNVAGEMQAIRNERDLRNAIALEFRELYLRLPGEVNEFEPSSNSSSAPPPSSAASPYSSSPPVAGPPVPPKPSSNGKVSQPTSMSRAASQNIPTRSAPQPILNSKPEVQQPKTLTKSASQPVKPYMATKPALVTPVSTSQPKSSATTSPTLNRSAATKAAPALPQKKKNVWQECYTDEGERYFFNTETEETSWDPDIDPSPPWMVCYTDAGDKYYYNPTNDSSTWEFPG